MGTSRSTGSRAGLPDDLIQSLFEDDRGRIWVSTRSGIAYFENGRFNHVPGIPGGVHAIAGDAAGNIWISEDESLLHVVGGRVAGRIPWATLGRKRPGDADGVRCRCAAACGSDSATGPGWRISRMGESPRRTESAEGLGRGMVGDLRLDSDGTVWAATEGGLSRIKNGRIHTLTAKDGLPCDGVHWATEDDDRAFWLYTPCGLARIARAQLDAWARAVDAGDNQPRPVQATLFDSSDGVRIHTAPGGYTPPVGKSPDGRIWFLPWDGVSVIDPRRLPFNQLPPPVHIEQITADGRSYAPTPGLRLPPLARDITIDYTALSLVAPEKIRFRYRLEGQDPQWREVVNDRRVQYSNLGPGHVSLPRHGQQQQRRVERGWRPPGIRDRAGLLPDDMVPRALGRGRGVRARRGISASDPAAASRRTKAAGGRGQHSRDRGDRPARRLQ